MKIKMYQAANIAAIESKFLEAPLKISTSYRLIKLFKSLESDCEFYRQKLQNLISEYSEKDENGNPVQIESGIKIIEDKLDEARGKIAELDVLEIEVPDIKFTIEELDSVALTPIELSSFMDFIE